MPKGVKGFQKGHPSFSEKGRFTPGQSPSPETQFKPGRKPWNSGLSANVDERVQRSCAAAHAATRGKPAWNKGATMPPLTPEHKAKMSASLRGKYVGPESSNWKNDASGESKRARMSAEYREWRERVFTRDNWTCQLCRVRGGKLHPHHIKPFATHIDLRFEVSNGQTLCDACHRETHRAEGNSKSFSSPRQQKESKP